MEQLCLRFRSPTERPILATGHSMISICIAQYSAQPLNYARACEVVALSQQYGKWYWRTKIAGQNRGDYWGFVKKSPVVATSEMIVSTQNDCMAGFNNVEYKGDYTWMYFVQDNRIEYDPPFSLVWYYTWKYSTHAGDL